jgi:hypothetical protein
VEGPLHDGMVRSRIITNIHTYNHIYIHIIHIDMYHHVSIRMSYCRYIPDHTYISWCISVRVCIWDVTVSLFHASGPTIVAKQLRFLRLGASSLAPVNCALWPPCCAQFAALPLGTQGDLRPPLWTDQWPGTGTIWHQKNHRRDADDQKMIASKGGKRMKNVMFIDFSCFHIFSMQN